MATRSTIAIEYADGQVDQIYCHWDGYLDNNGKLLSAHYMDPFEVQKLMGLGDMSSLSATVDGCNFYMRDRGETDCNARRYQNADEYFDTCQQEEYDYILRNVNGVATWYVRCYSTNGVWVTMNEAVQAERKVNEMEDA